MLFFFLQSCFFLARARWAGDKCSKTFLYFGVLEIREVLHWSKICYVVDVLIYSWAYLSRGKAPGGRGQGLEKGQHWSGPWSDQQRCTFLTVRWTVWKIAIILLKPKKRAAPQVRSTPRARGCEVPADGRSRVGGQVGAMLRSSMSSEESMITSQENQYLVARPQRGHQRSIYVERKQAIVRGLHQGLVSRKFCLSAAPFFPPETTEKARI